MILRQFGAFALLLSGIAFAQKQAPADPCKAKPQNATYFFDLTRFDHEMRDALERRDATSMAFLVSFPVRVNRSSGTILLADPEALRTHFDDIFSPAVVKEILAQDPSDLGCRSMEESVGYGRGEIWVKASSRGYAIWVINPESPQSSEGRKPQQLQFVCQTDTHRIVINETSDDFLYRSWKLSRPLSAKPDLELAHGKQTFEGTSICAVPVLSFRNGDTTYEVDEGLGCFAPGEATTPPENATGSITVTTSGKIVLHDWCY